MTEEKMKALEKDIFGAVNNADLCRLCQNCMIEPRPECVECDLTCEECRAFNECKCGNCISDKNFELRKDYGLADEAPSAEDKTGGWIKPEERMPKDGECVLVIVNGAFENLIFENGVELAEYSSKEGWILESFPEYENPGIKWWRTIPEPPEEG